MKIKLNIKNVLVLSILAVVVTSISLFFINTSLATNTAKIVVETANIRKTADANASIVELANQGDTVEILETEGEWYKVKYGNIIGYLRKDLLELQSKEEIEENQNTENTENQVQANLTEENTTTSENKTTEQSTENETAEDEVQTSTDTETEGEIGGIYKLKEDTKLKIIPLIHALEVDNISKDTEVEVLDIINKWAYIKTEEKQGWAVLEKLEKIKGAEPAQESEKTTPETQEPTQAEEPTETTTPVAKTMYVNAGTVNIRSKADRSASIVTTVDINTAVEVVAEVNGWSQVNVSGKQGYILSSLLSERKQETSRGMTTPRTQTTQTATQETTTKSTATSTTSKGTEVVAYAKQYIGVKYTYGGSSPSTGFDCSGFTSYIYKHFGINLPRTSGEQAKVGTAVNRANLQLGDLVVYRGHVAIYVGGGNVIHAPKPGKTVCIVSINNAASGFLGARRIV